MKNRKFVTVSLAAALAIGTIAANGVLVSADAKKSNHQSSSIRNTTCRDP